MRLCLSGGMVDTLVLGTSATRVEVRVLSKTSIVQHRILALSFL